MQLSTNNLGIDYYIGDKILCGRVFSLAYTMAERGFEGVKLLGVRPVYAN